MSWFTDRPGARVAGRVAATGLVVLLMALIGGARWAAVAAGDAFSNAQIATRVSADYQQAIRAANLEADLLDSYDQAPSPATRAQFEQATRAAADALAQAVRDDRTSSDRGIDTVALERNVQTLQRRYTVLFAHYAAAVDAGHAQQASALNRAADALLTAMVGALADSAARQQRDALTTISDAGAVQDRVEIGALAAFLVVLGLVALFTFMGVRSAALRREMERATMAATALRQSENRYRRIMDTAQEGIWLLDAEHRTTFVNQTLADLLGYGVEEMAGKPVSFFMDADGQAIAATSLDLRRQGIAEHLDCKFIRKDGTALWTRLAASAVLDASGRYDGVLAMVSDITARRQAEEALRQSEARFRILIECAPEAIVVYDGGLDRFADANAKAERLFGCCREQLLAVGPAHFYSAEQPDGQVARETVAEYNRQALAGEEVVYERVVRPAAGEDVHCEVRLVRLPSQDRQLLRASFIDITERKRADARAIVLSRVMEQTADLVVITDKHGVIEYVNPAVVALTGYQPEEMLGQSPRLLKSGHQDASFYAQMWQTIAHGESFGAVFVNKKKTGELYYEEKTVGPLTDSQGRITHFVSTGKDITRRVQAEEQAQRHLRRLAALRTIDLAITASGDLRLTLGLILDQARGQLGIHAAAVLRFNAQTLVLDCVAERGFSGSSMKQQLRLGEGLPGRAALERTLISIADLRQEQVVRRHLVGEEAFIAYVAVPLIAKGQVQGVLELFHRAPFTPAPDWLEFLEALAGQTAIALDNATLFADLQRSNLELRLAYDTTIEGWSRALDLRDKETQGHSQRVTEMTVALARKMGLSDEEIVQVRRGALLHDIGKMGVPDAILLKPEPLTAEEWVLMRQHPGFAYLLLSPIAYLRPALEIPYGHHEKWDGSGYPRGLHGEQIPLAARIFAIADVWDALRSDRPYRTGWSDDKVREHIRSLAGTHFDPRVVAAFLELEGAAFLRPVSV
jgi:PAS domain S-box-containing protein